MKLGINQKWWEIDWDKIKSFEDLLTTLKAVELNIFCRESEIPEESRTFFKEMKDK